MYKSRVGLIGLGKWGKNIYRNLETFNVLEKVYDNPFDAREASDEEDRKNLQEGRRTDMSRDRDFGYIKGNKYRD